MDNVTGKINFWGKYELEICDTGFTLWDAVKRRWILDASCIAEDDAFQVGRDDMGLVKKKRTLKFCNYEFETRYKTKVAQKSTGNRPKAKTSKRKKKA